RGGARGGGGGAGGAPRRNEDDRHEHDGHRAPLALQRSTRIDTRACSSGSGNNGPTRGRFVTDRYDTSTVIGSPTRGRSPTSTSAPPTVRPPPRSPPPPPASPLPPPPPPP